MHRLNLALDHEDPEGNSQIFIYSAGVGAYNDSSKYYAGAFGEGLNSLILNAYINLASNYVPGDRIYIFGFSRGAIAARALTGFLSHVGLLKPNKLSLVQAAWHYFTQHKDESVNFASFSTDAIEVEVEFLGVWDSVAGPHKFEELCRSYRFEDKCLVEIVKCGIHILAIDESRGAFLPLLWDRCKHPQVLEQIWLPGVHCDIGGGYRAEFLSDVSLLLMIERLQQRCPDLSFDVNYIKHVLLKNTNRENVAVNDEWGIWFVPIRKRWRNKRWGYMYRTVNASAEQRHFVHPLVARLSGQTITIRSQKTKYRPSFLVESSSELAQADTAKTEIGKQLKDILDRKIADLNANSHPTSPVTKAKGKLKSWIARLQSRSSAKTPDTTP